MIHGSVNADSFLVGEDSLSAVLGWAALRVGDPAWDLHWLINVDADAQDSAFGAYAAARRSSADPKLRQRATLYSELELARWLLHGVDEKSPEIVDDAINMLDRLVDSVHSETSSPIGPGSEKALSVTQVVELLDETPGSVDRGGYRGMEPVTDNQRSSSSSSE